MTIQSGSALSEEDEFYIRWGYESLKANLQLCNAVLRQLVTLSAAFLGSGAYFLQNGAMSAPLIALTLGLLFVSLVAALLGVLPYSGTVDLNAPKDLKAHKTNALKSKRRYILLSAAPLILALLVAGVSVTVTQWWA
jgi:hypothetical protein